MEVVGGEGAMGAQAFLDDLATLRAQPIEGFDEHVRMFVRAIANKDLRVVFVRWYARLCRGYDQLFEMNINPSNVFAAGWNKVHAWSHYSEDLLDYITDNESFATVDSENLMRLSKQCIKVFILHDYLLCFDAEAHGHHIPLLTRIFALLSALNAPERYAAAREVALSGLGDGGDD